MQYVETVSFGSEAIPYDNSRFVAFCTDLAVHTFNPNLEQLSIPALDRFCQLLITLKDPSATQHLRQKFENELTLMGFPKSLVNDEQFMLLFQMVSMAKNHNYYGRMDNYMREFTKIVLEDPVMATNL